MESFIKIAIWFVMIMFISDWAFKLITIDSTIANIVGLAIAIAIVYVSVRTKCFTTITFKTNKNEKSN